MNGKKQSGDCEYQPAGVICYQPWQKKAKECEKCGWNPEVERRRKEAIRQRRQ